jgi:copper chaperone CopZ
MKSAIFQLESLSCPSCIIKIERTLEKTGGVEEARVFFNSSKVKVEFYEADVTEEKLQATIEELGYPVVA